MIECGANERAGETSDKRGEEINGNVTPETSNSGGGQIFGLDSGLPRLLISIVFYFRTSEEVRDVGMYIPSLVYKNSSPRSLPVSPPGSFAPHSITFLINHPL